MKKSLNFKSVLKFILFHFMCLCGQNAYSQDVDKIFTKDSTTLHVLIQKIRSDFVYFKHYNQTSDDISSMHLSNVYKITLKNGKTQHYAIVAKDSNLQIPFFPVYVDASLGLGFGLFADVNLGYRINEKNAIGASLMAWTEPSACCAHSAEGFGVQWRITPNRKILYKLELGYINKANYGDDGPYNAVYNHKKSNKFYQRLTAARRFSVFQIGLTVAIAGGQKNDNFDSITRKLLRTSVFSVNSLVLSLGIATPRFVKRKNK